MTFIAEGNKKCRGLTRDCRAVSEVMGAVLMIAIVVLAFSAVALTVFSDEGSMDPPHTPHTNLRENINTSEDTVQIFHNGGEEIDLKYIKIILEVDGERAEFDMSDFEVFDPERNNIITDGVFALGDCIVIDPSSKINIEHGDVVDFYFVHTESSQVIQKTKLWIKGKEFPEWITPHTFPGGTAYDSYTEKPLDTELVDKINGKSTSSHIPKDKLMYENFTFAIDTEELEIPESTLFTNITLKIVCTRHDNSRITMKPEIYNGSQWTQLAPPISFDGSNNYVEEDYPITEYVKTTTELENLEVRILADGHAGDNADKTFHVDFVGIHLEY
ncbi:hypothetical protein EO95_13480 [Methanosarcina sp. 1.H.T.1A.1]|uniref:type IV pilin N-terminal domain-containing protein n=1 Tax=Methanosarcina sp. 1.H.T.1A.1 TaxID=1483602 RepID=UPI0006225719|nr:type IV pilin N-terminal domain-containing protein [Methanosarcina sp. 1.H.T.1A.1]KKH93309.1 hypothetical protein EO95_13480 [Methanosarcina sp. 1.H.T.1A.1]